MDAQTEDLVLLNGEHEPVPDVKLAVQGSEPMSDGELSSATYNDLMKKVQELEGDRKDKESQITELQE